MSGRFSEDEARRIFARAARRQHVADPGTGLSVEELVEIGANAGLDPALITAEAAIEKAAGETGETWHGVPVGISQSRLLPGRLSDAEWEQVVDLLRAEYKTAGIAEQVGRRREWRAPSSHESVEVRIEERPDGDLVTLRRADVYRATGMILGIVFAMTGTLLGSVITFAPKGGLAEGLGVGGLFLLVALLAYGGTLLAARTTASKVPDRFATLLDRIDLISRTEAGPAPLATAHPRAEDIRQRDRLGTDPLGIDLLDAEARSGEEAPVRRRQRS
ncbi:MAG: hypothetical protein AAGK21_00270 [Bacteroidota bacterium]